MAAPPASDARWRRVFLAAAIAVAATRIWSVAESPWDWDEMLFALGVRDFDMPSHHPHPPGFPLFIAFAKVLRAAGIGEFSALQAVAVVGAIALFPSMVFFMRELRFQRATAMTGGLILAFMPNVWLFGGAALSDVPSVALVVLACALLFRGCRSDASLIAGALVLAIAAGFRPQNLLIGFFPAIAATVCAVRTKRGRALFVAIAAGAVVVTVSYAAAVQASGGWTPYAEAVRAHQHYISTVDSFLNETRPPLVKLLDDFFIRPYRARAINVAITFFAAVSVVWMLWRRRWNVAVALAAFGPFCIFAWLYLDRFSVSRFSIGYAPLIALLAADGIRVLARRPAVEIVGAGVLIGGMALWSVPYLAKTRSEPAPPAAAVGWVTRHLDQRRNFLYVHGSMGPYAEAMLPQFRTEVVEWNEPFAQMASDGAWYIAEGTARGPDARQFSWPHDRLWDVARRR